MILRSNTFVQHQETLHGWTSRKPIQVYVLSNDGLWYLQKNVVFHGRKRFSVECFFGNETTQPGSVFKVVAVVSDERPHSPVVQLPEGAKSNPVTVILQ